MAKLKSDIEIARKAKMKPIQKILDSIKSNVTQHNSEPTVQKGLALAILFVQLAKIDNDFSTEEHQLIIKILQDRYSIDKTEATKMIQEAETVEQETSDTVQITKEIKGISKFVLENY